MNIDDTAKNSEAISLMAIIIESGDEYRYPSPDSSILHAASLQIAILASIARIDEHRASSKAAMAAAIVTNSDMIRKGKP